MTSRSEDYIKRMSDALRSGAKMLQETCPVCSSPLFSIRGEMWCLKCNKRVVKVSELDEVGEASIPYLLASISNTIYSKIEELNILLQRATEPEEIMKISNTLESLLRLIRESRRIAQEFKQET